KRSPDRREMGCPPVGKAMAEDQLSGRGRAAYSSPCRACSRGSEAAELASGGRTDGAVGRCFSIALPGADRSRMRAPGYDRGLLDLSHAGQRQERNRFDAPRNRGDYGNQGVASIRAPLYPAKRNSTKPL